MPAPAPHPALVAPQYADSRPMPVLRWMVVRLETTSALRSSSWETPISRANTMTGSEAVMP